MRVTRLVVPAVALLLAASAASAQGRTAAAARPGSNASMISVNPLGLMFGVVSGEIDHAMNPSSDVAASFSLWSPDGFTYASAEAKYKYLPSGNGLAGFYIGPTAGFTHIGVDASELVSCTQNCAESANALTGGLELGYTWLLGASNSFGITTGLGAKKLFFMGDKVGGASTTIPTIKLNVGWAF